MAAYSQQLNKLKQFTRKGSFNVKLSKNLD